ncbi:rad3 [Symbiodinium sp. KB8]|nr:rad3 [Symbiodinium sp. KB8]
MDATWKKLLQISDKKGQDRELHTLFAQRTRIAEAAETAMTRLRFYRGSDFPGELKRPGNSGIAKLLELLRSEKWRVLVPLQSQMTATIPRMNSAEQLRLAKPRSFFPEAILTERCLEHVEVFRSKELSLEQLVKGEKPKKLTFLGSDGQQYPFLCKAEKRGDLRKDSRLMEFAVMVNQLLAKPLAPVLLLPFLVMDRLSSLSDGPWATTCKAFQSAGATNFKISSLWALPVQNVKPSLEGANTLPKALWCMLGYLVGLGDRHGENILLDTESGRMVHVDFDCLFGKGMLLEKPEMVPFRLTQNCVAVGVLGVTQSGEYAMGVTGVEGTFRQCCEVTMEVLRDRANTQTLLSVLHASVQTARDTIGDVEKKLNGMLNVGALVPARSRDRGAGLSVQGQVDELIKAAMCKRNLSQMYVGAAPAVLTGFDGSRGYGRAVSDKRLAALALSRGCVLRLELLFLFWSIRSCEILVKQVENGDMNWIIPVTRVQPQRQP